MQNMGFTSTEKGHNRRRGESQRIRAKQCKRHLLPLRAATSTGSGQLKTNTFVQTCWPLLPVNVLFICYNKPVRGVNQKPITKKIGSAHHGSWNQVRSRHSVPLHSFQKKGGCSPLPPSMQTQPAVRCGSSWRPTASSSVSFANLARSICQYPRHVGVF